MTEIDNNRSSFAGSLLASFQFLSIFPPIVKRPFTYAEMGASVAFYPVVGLVFGGILWGAYALLQSLFLHEMAVALAIVIWSLLSGGLHLDGLMDSADGLFGSQKPEMRLEIMKDERVGAFGVIAAVLLILTKFVALNVLEDLGPALLFVPTLGRWSLSFLILLFPYGREQGLGRVMKDYSRPIHLVTATLITLLLAAYLGIHVVGIMLASVLFAFFLAKFTLKRIPGLTGDSYGSICVLVELFALILFGLSVFQ